MDKLGKLFKFVKIHVTCHSSNFTKEEVRAFQAVMRIKGICHTKRKLQECNAELDLHFQEWAQADLAALVQTTCCHELAQIQVGAINQRGPSEIDPTTSSIMQPSESLQHGFEL